MHCGVSGAKQGLRSSASWAAVLTRIVGDEDDDNVNAKSDRAGEDLSGRKSSARFEVTVLALAGLIAAVPVRRRQAAVQRLRLPRLHSRHDIQSLGHRPTLTRILSNSPAARLAVLPVRHRYRRHDDQLSCQSHQ